MRNAELIAALDKLDALFSDESKWTQSAFSRDPTGDPHESMWPTAVCWCVFGGMMKVTDGDPDDLKRALFPDGESPLAWNDFDENRTFADVKRLIADTRARLEAS